MLLVIDVGNTNMKLGVYDGDVLKKSWRLSTEAKRTADELGMILYDLFKNVGVEFQDIDGIIMSSVAPMLNYTVGAYVHVLYEEKARLRGRHA